MDWLDIEGNVILGLSINTYCDTSPLSLSWAYAMVVGYRVKMAH